MRSSVKVLSEPAQRTYDAFRNAPCDHYLIIYRGLSYGVHALMIVDGRRVEQTLLQRRLLQNRS